MGNLIGVHSVDTMYSIKKTFELDKYPERYEVIIKKCLEAERQNKVDRIRFYLRKKWRLGFCCKKKGELKTPKKKKSKANKWRIAPRIT